MTSWILIGNYIFLNFLLDIIVNVFVEQSTSTAGKLLMERLVIEEKINVNELDIEMSDTQSAAPKTRNKENRLTIKSFQQSAQSANAESEDHKNNDASKDIEEFNSVNNYQRSSIQYSLSTF